MTFTIVAGDPNTGEMGVATTTCLVGVGDVVPAAKAGIGVVACQAHIRPSNRAKLLYYLTAGITLERAVEMALQDDPQADRRQILGIDAACKPFVYTGVAVEGACGSVIGTHHVIAGNLLLHTAVLHAVDMSFQMPSTDSLAHRLVRALLAGEQAGGDKRGRMSAALCIAAPNQRSVSLRIDYSADPLTDLKAAVVHRLTPSLNDAFNR